MLVHCSCEVHEPVIVQCVTIFLLRRHARGGAWGKHRKLCLTRAAFRGGEEKKFRQKEKNFAGVKTMYGRRVTFIFSVARRYSHE